MRPDSGDRQPEEGAEAADPLVRYEGRSVCSFSERKLDTPFSPNLCIQRYEYVTDLLLRDCWKRKLRRLVDVGANNCKFLGRLRNGGYKFWREIIALDVDEDVLSSNFYRTKQTLSEPAHKDLVRRFFPCDVYHMAGSVGDVDARLKNVDAVVGIELIEHLEPSTLERLPYVVFGHMKPKLAVFTTPNFEFNVLFNDFQGPFRHWDHKFEFTRAEFREWAHRIVAQYPQYKVEFDGVGEPKSDVEGDYGFCTQIAIFTDKEFGTAASNGEFAAREVGSYIDPDMNLVEKAPEVLDDASDYPYKIAAHNYFRIFRDDRTMEERVEHVLVDALLDVHYRMRHCNGVEEPKIYFSQIEENFRNECYDNYGDGYDVTPQKIRQIVANAETGVHSGEDEGGIFYTVDDDYYFKAPSEDDDYYNNDEKEEEDNQESPPAVVEEEMWD